MTLTAAQHSNLISGARDVRKLIERIWNEWSPAVLTEPVPDTIDINRARLALKVLREISSEGVELTQGRAPFWRNAEACANELSEILWDDKWGDDRTGDILRAWKDSMVGEEQ